MKKKLSLLLITLLISFNVKSQCTLTISNVSLIPINYNSNDTIKAILDVWLLCDGSDLGQSFSINSNQINISSCYHITAGGSVENYIDTITLGILPPANYNLIVNAYESLYDTVCTHYDTVTTSIQFDVLTGINTFNKNLKISIYPDPVIDNINIKTPQFSSIEISNIEGQIIKTIVNSGTKTNVDHVGYSSYVVNVSDFPSGVYIVEVKTEKGIAVKKFIKE